jgi:hypothetical protein
MADIKISALSALTGANTATDDLYVVVDSNVPETKKQTRAELFQNVPDMATAGTFVHNEAGADKDARFEGDTDANLLFTDASTDRVGIGTATPVTKFQVNGGMAANAPVVITADYTVNDTTAAVINNKTGTAAVITLPAAANSAGRYINFINKQASLAITSSATNILPRTTAVGGTLSTQIVASGIGNWSLLWCDGTNWYVVAGT